MKVIKRKADGCIFPYNDIVQLDLEKFEIIELEEDSEDKEVVKSKKK